MSNDSIKVLLIEDNPGDCRLIKEMLAEESEVSYDFKYVDSLSIGLQAVANEKSDVILLDLGLPDSQGLDTLKRVRTQFPGKPTVVLTGLDSQELALEAMHEGAQDYLVKGKMGNGEALWRIIRHAIERKKMEEMLRQTAERLKEAQSLGKIGNWEWDIASGKIEWSDEVYRLYQRDKALGPPSTEEESRYYSKGQLDKLRELSRRAVENGKGYDYDLTVTLPGGKNLFFAASMRPLKDKGGRVVKLFGTVQDITQRKTMEDQLLTSSKLASIGELAAGVAHEINNPLAAIMGYAQLLLDREDIPHDAKIDLDRVVQQSQRAAKVVQNLLRFARRHEAEKSYVDINELVRRTLELRNYELRTSNTEVITDLKQGLPPIMADYNQMQQVIINIMLNAEQAMAGAGVKGKIIIRTNLISGYLSISLIDNGPGIAPEHISKIFDPFFTTKEVGTGSGLGLPICYGIIAEHKGTIRVESELGKGATFIIELPLAPDGQVEPAEDIVEGKGSIISKKITTGKVLVVDDEPLIRDILRRFLIRAGNTVESVSGGNEALEMLAEGGKYDLFLVDVKMPGMSGNEFHSILQQKHPDMVEKIVFITGDIVTRETNDFLVATGRPHLAKPFNYDELINIIGSILGDSNERK